jgi:hypothetical protein
VNNGRELQRRNSNRAASPAREDPLKKTRRQKISQNKRRACFGRLAFHVVDFKYCPRQNVCNKFPFSTKGREFLCEACLFGLSHSCVLVSSAFASSCSLSSPQSVVAHALCATSKSPRQGPRAASMNPLLRYIFIIYFITHIPITLCLDLQVIFGTYYPTTLKNLFNWYCTTHNDQILLLQPIWLKSFIWCEFLSLYAHTPALSPTLTLTPRLILHSNTPIHTHAHTHTHTHTHTGASFFSNSPFSSSPPTDSSIKR